MTDADAVRAARPVTERPASRRPASRRRTLLPGQPDRLRLRRSRSSWSSRRSALPLDRHRVGLAARRPADDVRPVRPGSVWTTTATCSRTTFFWNAFKNTITIGIISTVPQLCMALGHRAPAQLPAARPDVLPGRDADAVRDEPGGRDGDLRRALRPELGLINWALQRRCTCRRSTGRARSGRRQIAVSTIVTWRWTGYNALIYLAGMQSIDSTLYEAASIDGASRWAPVPPRHPAGPAADDPVHDRGVDHRRDPALR